MIRTSHTSIYFLYGVIYQMKEKEEKAREQRKKELETLLVKREADAVFAANEEEKRNRRFNELKDLQKTHLDQAVSISYTLVSNVHASMHCFLHIPAVRVCSNQ